MNATQYTIAALLIIPALFIAHDFYGDSRSGQVFEQAVRGEDESAIVKRLGDPDTTEACGENLWWEEDTNAPLPNNGLCVKWARYNYFLSAWAFGYSASGKLVSRYHYVSE